MNDHFSTSMDRPVVTADTAETIGSIKAFVMSSDGARVVSLQVVGKRRHAEFLQWSNIRSFGPDAVVSEPVTEVDLVGTDADRAYLDSKLALVGSRVLTTAGSFAGRVRDVEFDTGTGAVTVVESDEGPIDPTRLRSLGTYALVVEPLS